MNRFFTVLPVVLVSIALGAGLSVASANESTHPFKMSTEINAATLDAMGANHPAIGAKEVTKPANAVIRKGKVIEVVDADDFSYLRIESDKKEIWIAGIKVKAKVGDNISYAENVTMDNFVSKALNRTFAKVVFVSSVSVVK